MLDINVLPWFTQRQRRRQQIRCALNWTVLMVMGWSGCGDLWHACWRNENAAQWLANAAPVSLSSDDEQQLAAEKWRLCALKRQQQRLQIAYQLAALWQGMTERGEHIKAVEWRPESLEWEVAQRSSTVVESLQQTWQKQGIDMECHALSSTVTHCQRLSSRSNEPADE